MPQPPYTSHIRTPLANNRLKLLVQRVVMFARSRRRDARCSQMATSASDDNRNALYNVEACSRRKRSTGAARWMSLPEIAAGRRLVGRADLLPAADAPGNDAGHGANAEKRENVRLGQCGRNPRQRGAGETCNDGRSQQSSQ